MTIVADLEKNTSFQMGGRAGLAALMQGEKQKGFRCYKKAPHIRINRLLGFFASCLCMW